MDNLQTTGFFFVVIAAISAAISFFIGIFFYSLSFLIHEYGHIIGGYIGSIIFNIDSPYMAINNTIPCPLFPLIRLPQSVHLSGTPTSYFIFGGSIAVILTMYIVAILIFSYLKIPRFNWLILTLPLIFLFSEIFGNTLCGTDNLQNAPIIQCNGIFWSIYMIIPFILFLPFFAHTFYGVSLLFKKFNNGIKSN
jgi:hypothetical protein